MIDYCPNCKELCDREDVELTPVCMHNGIKVPLKITVPVCNKCKTCLLTDAQEREIRDKIKASYRKHKAVSDALGS